jgi:hypothetical protein
LEIKMKTSHLKFSCRLLACVVLAIIGNAHATTWVVNQTTDFSAAGPICDATNCELRNAIALAQAGDIIEFSALFSVPQTITILTELNVDKSLEIRGPIGAQLTITCQLTAVPASGIVINSPATSSSITDLTIQGCGYSPVGAALDIKSGSAVIKRVQILGSVFEALKFSSQAAFEFSDGIITGSTRRAMTVSASTVNLRNSTISDNGAGVALSGLDGAVFNVVQSDITRNGTVASPSFGLSVDARPTTSLNIIGSTFLNNISSQFGGGISCFGGAVNLVDSSINGNRSGQFGGGIYINRGTLSLLRTTVSDNAIVGSTQNSGGAIDCEACPSMEITNSTISGNRILGSSQGSAGGIWTNSNNVKVNNSTITNNLVSVADGGTALGLRLQPSQTTASLIIGSSIIAANAYQNGYPDVRVTNGTFPNISRGYNLIGNSVGASFVGASDQIGSILQPVNPQLGPLADNGGITLTHEPLPTSPAVDQGNAFGQLLDQRSEARTVDLPGAANAADGTDVGAVEISASYFRDGFE